METPTDPAANDEDERPFLAVARDPAGATFHVQAVPVFGVSGPVLLGGREGPATRGLLGFANRILARHGRTKSEDGFGVFVHRDDPRGPIVAESEHGSMRQDREAAQHLVHAIEEGAMATARSGQRQGLWQAATGALSWRDPFGRCAGAGP